MSAAQNPHWLVAAARALDLPASSDLDASSGEKVADVWTRITEATGTSDEELTRRLAERYLMRVADLGAAEPYATRLLPGIVAVKYQVLPLRYTDRTLDVATSDPHDVEAEREVSRLATRAVRFELAPPAAIRAGLAEAYAGSGRSRAAQGGAVASGTAPHADAGAPPAGAGVAASAAMAEGAMGTAAVAPVERAQGDGRTHVLVVDDDPETATLLQAFLEGKGFRVSAAPTGPEALDLLARDSSVDAISLDYYMHPMNGLKVLQAIRKRPSLDDVPVVMLTSSEDRNIEMSLFEAGADDYVVKPLDPPRFFLRLRAVLRRRRSA